jgi:hypothetical protein
MFNLNKNTKKIGKFKIIVGKTDNYFEILTYYIMQQKEGFISGDRQPTSLLQLLPSNSLQADFWVGKFYYLQKTGMAIKFTIAD